MNPLLKKILHFGRKLEWKRLTNVGPKVTTPNSIDIIMPLQENESTLASIISSDLEELTQWKSFKLPLKLRLLPAQFHKMFWGTSMADEEQKWCDDQPPMPAEGAGLENKFQGGGEPMDVDVSEEEELDDDIIEGCHFLEINIKGFQHPRIWIHAKYIQIYNTLEACYQAPVYPYLASAVVITGQPGIGK